MRWLWTEMIGSMGVFLLKDENDGPKFGIGGGADEIS